MMLRLRKATKGWEEQVPVTKILECECEICEHEGEYPMRAQHEQINLLVSRLDEQQRLWYVAVESNRIGHGEDVVMARNTGMDEKTIRRGRREMETGLGGRPTTRIRMAGGGRPLTEKKRHG